MYDQPSPEKTAEDKMNPQLPAIRETGGKGLGVFSTVSLAKGDVAIVGKPVSRLPERTWRTLQMDVATHVAMDAPFEFVNHSCGPNCGIKANEHNGYNLVAMRDIEVGEEITFDYCMTEWTIVGFRACHCNSAQCRKVIKGGKFLSLEKIQEYDDYTAPYYRTLFTVA